MCDGRVEILVRKFDKLNKKRLLNASLPNVVVYSDASNVAAGAYTVELKEKIFHCNWSEYE
jgi:hypothetical protein